MNLPENKECICPREKCPRHGSCAECRTYHANKSRPPYCERAKQKAASLNDAEPRRTHRKR